MSATATLVTSVIGLALTAVSVAVSTTQTSIFAKKNNDTLIANNLLEEIYTVYLAYNYE